jgi:pilus assembly protein CpaC
MTIRRPVLLLVLAWILILSQGVPGGQGLAQGPPQPTPPDQPPVAPAGGNGKVSLIAGQSTVLMTDFDITRIAVTNPAVADAVVVQPREILVDGKGSGTVSLIVWGSSMRKQYEVVVEPPVTALQQRLQNLFPGEDILVTTNDEAIVLSGRVSSTAVMLKAAEIAKASSEKSKVVNMLQLPGGQASQQVMLQVRFAEVNRRALQELGISFFTTPTGWKNNLGRIGTQQFAMPGYEDLEKTVVNGQITNVAGTITFSDFLNIFVLNWKYDVGAVVRALKSKGFFQSLAEPNLIAYNGKEASFLAGGEFPVPVVQGVTNAVTIDWKEFGVRLNFTPTIAGDVIHLHVRPEVSSLDFNNGITLQGFRIPSLITRRADTEVELRDGQSFAIAGLLNNLSQENTSNVPFLSSIPIIGNLFKSKAEQAEKTELMVLITPQLVRPLEPDEVPPLPTQPKSFIKDPGDPGNPPIADAPAANTNGAKPKKEVKPGK